MVAKRFVSYDNMNTMLSKVFRDMANAGYRPDVVVGLVRGGLVPAVHVSHYFDVPMVAFKYSLRDHPGADDFQKLVDLISNQKVVIVDDICDEGHTLFEIIANLKQANEQAVVDNVRTAVLQHNLGATLFEPDFAGEEINKVEKPEWIVYPFEY